MGLIIDQTWIRAWQTDAMNPAELQFLQDWVLKTPPSLHGLLVHFPPLALVRGKVPLEVPYPYSIGIVSSYATDGRVGIRQEPTSDDVLVDARTIEVVGFWKSFTPINVTEILRPRVLGL